MSFAELLAQRPDYDQIFTNKSGALTEPAEYFIDALLDQIRILSESDVMSASLDANFDITANTITPLTGMSLDDGNADNFSSGVYTFSYGGSYQINAGAGFQVDSDGDRLRLYIQKSTNGGVSYSNIAFVSSPASGATNQYTSLSRGVNVDAGDKIRIAVANADNDDTILNGSLNTYFSVH